MMDAPATQTYSPHWCERPERPSKEQIAMCPPADYYDHIRGDGQKPESQRQVAMVAEDTRAGRSAVPDLMGNRRSRPIKR